MKAGFLCAKRSKDRGRRKNKPRLGAWWQQESCTCCSSGQRGLTLRENLENTSNRGQLWETLLRWNPCRIWVTSLRPSIFNLKTSDCLHLCSSLLSIPSVEPRRTGFYLHPLLHPLATKKECPFLCHSISLHLLPSAKQMQTFPVTVFQNICT